MRWLKKIFLGVFILGITAALTAAGPQSDELTVPTSPTWSRGVLSVVRASAPDTPITAWDAGLAECPQTVTSEVLRLKNTGTESINVGCPIMPSGHGFTRSTNCPCTSVLAAGQTSSCTFTITFSPTQDGVTRDTLRIQSNSWNSYGGFVRIPVSGTRVTTPESPRIALLPQGRDMQLTWNTVSESPLGCPLSGVQYLIYTADAIDGPFSYLASTPDTSYLHTGVLAQSSYVFYRVTTQTP